MSAGNPVDPRFALPKTLVFGLGAQKSGTTWLGDYFSTHPEVHMSVRKEIHFWNSIRPPFDTFPAKVRSTNQARANKLRRNGSLLQRTLEKIRRRKDIQAMEALANVTANAEPPFTSYADMLFLGYRRQPVVMEITPAYARLGEASFREMCGLANDVRFVFLMREPLTRLISGIRHHQRLQVGPEKVTTDTVEAQLRRVLSQEEHPILERSQYDKTITSLESAVPTSNIFYGFYETLFDQTEIDRLCTFLGVRSVKAEIDKKVFVGQDRSGQLSNDLLKEAAARLQSVYDFTETRFGTIPDAWKDARGT